MGLGRRAGELGWPLCLGVSEPEAGIELRVSSVLRVRRSPCRGLGWRDKAAVMPVSWFGRFPHQGPAAGSGDIAHGSFWKPRQIPLGQTFRQVLKTGCLSASVSQGEDRVQGSHPVPLCDDEPPVCVAERFACSSSLMFGTTWVSGLCWLRWVEAEGWQKLPWADGVSVPGPRQEGRDSDAPAELTGCCSPSLCPCGPGGRGVVA